MQILLVKGKCFEVFYTVVALLKAGHNVVLLDNTLNGRPGIVERIDKFTGECIKHYALSIKEKNSLRRIFGENHIDCVIYFAGLNSTVESITHPIKYYRDNIDAILSLLECMRGFSVKKLVFTSSATVYGEKCSMPCVESMMRGYCINPYSWTMYMIEQIIEDTVKAYPEMSAVLLRCFNVAGSHERGLIEEYYNNSSNNLLSCISQVAAGKIDKLTVFGGDYDTPDGTCRRDFIHVMDLAQAHVKAIEYAAEHKGVEVFNIGTGTPYSVLEVIKTFEKVNGVKVNYEIGPRRPGDLPEVWANVDKSAKVLGWRATRSLEDMCRDAWNWQVRNPDRYGE